MLRYSIPFYENFGVDCDEGLLFWEFGIKELTMYSFKFKVSFLVCDDFFLLSSTNRFLVAWLLLYFYIGSYFDDSEKDDESSYSDCSYSDSYFSSCILSASSCFLLYFFPVH